MHIGLNLCCVIFSDFCDRQFYDCSYVGWLWEPWFNARRLFNGLQQGVRVQVSVQSNRHVSRAPVCQLSSAWRLHTRVSDKHANSGCGDTSMMVFIIRSFLLFAKLSLKLSLKFYLFSHVVKPHIIFLFLMNMQVYFSLFFMLWLDRF